LREGREIRGRALDPRDPDLAANLEALAVLYANHDQPAKAEPLHRRVLEMWVAVFGQDHPKTALVKKNLGSVLLDLERFDEARTFLADALRTRLALLGDQHPDVALSYADLASVDLELGQSAGAETSCREAVAIASGLGSEHRRRRSVVAACAQVLRRLGQEDRAARLEQELKGTE